MVKIICIGLDGGAIMSNRYKGPSGEEYLFHRGTATEVKNPADALSFLNAGGGVSFKSADGSREKVISELKKVTVKEEKKVAEEAKPKVQTYKELEALNKDEQIALIKKLDSDAKVPRLEDARIKVIQKLQNGGK